MKIKQVLILVISSFLFSFSYASEIADDATDDRVEELKAEINFIKLENDKLKKEIGEGLTKIEKKGKSGYWYVGISGGYGVPFLTTNKKSPKREIGEGIWEQSAIDGRVSRESKYGTNGGGFALNVNWGKMFNKYIGIDVQHTVGFHPESLDAKIHTIGDSLKLGELNLGPPSYYATQRTSSTAIYLAPHLVMRWDNGKRIGFTAKVGAVIPIFGNTVSHAKIDDNSARTLQTLNGIPPILGIPLIHMKIDAVAKTKYQPTIGLSTSFALDVKLSDRIWAFAEVRVQAYTIKLVETVMTEFKMSTDLKLGEISLPLTTIDDLIKDATGNLISLTSLLGGMPLNVSSAAEAPKYLTHYRYVDEITENSNTARYGMKSLIGDGNKIDINKAMDEPGVKYNTSALYFNVGLRMNLGKK